MILFLYPLVLEKTNKKEGSTIRPIVQVHRHPVKCAESKSGRRLAREERLLNRDNSHPKQVKKKKI